MLQKVRNMPHTYIEHVNVTVSDSARSARTLMDIFDWHVRWEGPAMGGGHSIHVGSDSHYIALYSPPPQNGQVTHFTKGKPLNHICIHVEDLDATEARVMAAGLKPFSHDDYHPGKRFYFFDDDGIEFEVVTYS
jgi:catechol 2,3-dioxygenase-like lactoylglutathione lyase family enzyme